MPRLRPLILAALALAIAAPAAHAQSTPPTGPVEQPATTPAPVAPERRITVTPVCGARTLAEGRPPLGIACAQQDIAHVYPLPDDPERCLEDFLERAADHARGLAARLEHQELSVERFLELSGEDELPAA